MSDHYQTLGIGKTATPDDIKRAYRKMAGKHHPDRGGDTATFQRVEEAYRVLSDPQQRAQYDNPQPNWAGAGHPGGFSFNFGGPNPFEDLFRQFNHQTQQRSQKMYTVNVNVTLEQVARGDNQSIYINTGGAPKAVEITIPRGIEDGQQVKYNGIMPDGLMVVTFRVMRHQKFERQGLDIHQKYEISIWDLILGTTIHTTDIYGNELTIGVNPKTKPNTTLRLVGRGMEVSGHRGNHFVLLSPVIPDIISVELLDLIKQEQNSK